MHTLNVMAVAFAVALLAGACATGVTDLAGSKAFCTDLGYREGTDSWKDCVLDLEAAWRHGRYKTVLSPEEQQRFCVAIGFEPGTDDLRYCTAELQAASAHGRSKSVFYDDRDRCLELGFQPDTNEFRRCLVIFEVAHRHRTGGVGTRRF